MAVIPNNPTRKHHHPFDRQAYRRRNLIERCFSHLKDWRRVATRCDKLATNLASAVAIAATFIYWLRVRSLELVADRDTRRPFAAAGEVGSRVLAAGHEHGLIVRAIGNVVALCPLLIINEEQVHETVNRLRGALDHTAQWRTSENLN